MTSVYVTHPRYPEHNLPGHPEHAGRIRAVWGQMDTSGLSTRMKKIEATPVNEEKILTVHTPGYIATLKWIDETKQERVHLDPDTYAGATVYEIARLSAGGVVLAVDEVLSGHSQ